MTHIVDEENLMNRVDGDREFLSELVEIFEAEYPAMIDRLRRALSGRDVDEAAATAHALKGMVGNFCAPGVDEMAVQLETTARSGSFDVMAAAIDVLDGELAQMRLELGSLVLKAQP